MNIEDIWQQNKGEDEQLHHALKGANLHKLHSRLPLHKLKKNLLLGIFCAVLITLLYGGLLFLIPLWQVQTGLVILILFNLWIMILSWKLYQDINENISPDHSLKEELEKNYSGFQRWWTIQERLGIFVYPVGAAAGFIAGGVEGSGKTVEDFLYNPRMLIIFGITLLILVPLCYYGARWMYHYAYGKHLKKLKDLINELSA